MILKALIILFLYTAIGFFEVIPLKKEKNKKKFILYLVLISFAAAISVLITLGVKIPSPSVPIKQFIISVFGK